MDFYHFTAEDFALMPEFRDWVLSPNRERNAYWAQWLDQNPEKLAVVEQARKLVENLPLIEHSLSADEIGEMSRAIEAQINLNFEEKLIAKPGVIPLNSYAVTEKARFHSKERFWRSWMGYAAGILVLLGTFYFMQNRFDSPVPQLSNYVVKESSRGQITQINLTDGSRIWLNADSRVKYPEDFSSGDRHIYLEGEAYFEVAHDTLRPFKVYSGEITTTALGTSFNVRHFKEDASTDVALLTGKVRVEELSKGNGAQSEILLPGDGAIWNSENRLMEKIKVDTEVVLKWRENIIYFQESNFESVQATLERWYPIEIITENESSHEWSYNGQFENESLDLVLKKLSLTENFTYRIEGNTVRITFNR